MDIARSMGAKDTGFDSQGGIFFYRLVEHIIPKGWFQEPLSPVTTVG